MNILQGGTDIQLISYKLHLQIFLLAIYAREVVPRTTTTPATGLP